MPYQATTIATAVNRLNTSYYLPAIQREFVWSPSQIIQLFDSLMRGYPISTFLFWELGSDSRNLWDIYRFIERFDPRDGHNDPQSAVGIQQPVLVLDGQQRLTSLLIGLKGSYTARRRHGRRQDASAWATNKLYLDLLQDHRQEPEDGEMGIRYGFEFRPDIAANDGSHSWFKVGRILEFDREDCFQQFRYEQRDALPDTLTPIQRQTFEMNLEKLHRVVWRDEVISYYTEQNQEFDRVLDIFVRANAGGTKLSKSDLLLSMVVAHWGNMNAREEIYGFVGRLNRDLIRRNAFDKDFVMKSCLVLTDLEVVYRIQNFTSENLRHIQQHWEAIKDAIARGVALVNSFGIDGENLTSTNALIPIIYYLFKNPGTTLQGTTPFDVGNARAIRRWLIVALLTGAFGRASDNLLRGIRENMSALPPRADFPVAAINTTIARTGLSAASAVDEVLEMRYSGQQTFLALSLLYDYNLWGATEHHQDHIFPRSLFRQDRPEFAGLSAERQNRYRDLMDSFANLELLTAQENLGRSDTDYQAWLTTRDTGFRATHLIPADDSLLSFDRFEEFVAAREDRIRQRLAGLLTP